MQFRLVIPRHNVQSKSYRDKVDIFRARTADPDYLLDLDRVGLLSRVRTAVPTGVQMPVSTCHGRNSKEEAWPGEFRSSLPRLERQQWRAACAQKTAQKKVIQRRCVGERSPHPRSDRPRQSRQFIFGLQLHRTALLTCY
jgi:hypothetical protein